MSNFDHAKTGFALIDKHGEAACADCHVSTGYKGLKSDCVACHVSDDIHADRFGAKCEECHTTSTWTKVRFEHDTDTKFRLLGAHEDVGCNDCHVQNVVTHPPGNDCADCHKSQDAHSGALGANCANCHGFESWFTDIKFDHDFTNFPLIGLHASAGCEGCHFDTSFQISKMGCVDCHVEDDKHKRTMGPACADCHNPTGWESWLFDHDKDTKFRLTGAHEKTTCSACHKIPTDTKPALGQQCIDCHRADDVHRGAFGTNCTACHSTSTFKGAKLR